MRRLAFSALALVVLLLVSLVVLAGGMSAPPQPLEDGACTVGTTPTPSTAPRPGTLTPTTTTSGRPTSPPDIRPLPAARTDVRLNARQMAAARAVAGVGRGMAITPRGVAIALAVAMQESTLNPDAVNGRSVGLFQQQGALYANVDRRDPRATAAAFYQMLLQRVPDYSNALLVGFAAAAQEVQRSGAGAHWYARWESWATTLATALLSGDIDLGAGTHPPAPGRPPVQCRPSPERGGNPVPGNGVDVGLPPASGFTGRLAFPNDAAATAARAALAQLGVPYAWGGGNSSGPTKGIPGGGPNAVRHGDANKIGFDCSGLMEYAYAKAGIAVGGDSRTQRRKAAQVVPFSQAQPGDLLFYGTGAIGNIHHVALYLGTLNDRHLMVEAPQSGLTVRVTRVRTGSDFRASEVGRVTGTGTRA